MLGGVTSFCSLSCGYLHLSELSRRHSPHCLQGWKPTIFALVGLGGGIVFLVLFAKQLRTETQRYKRD